MRPGLGGGLLDPQDVQFFTNPLSYTYAVHCAANRGPTGPGLVEFFFFGFFSFVNHILLYLRGLGEWEGCVQELNPVHVHKSIREALTALHFTRSR